MIPTLRTIGRSLYEFMYPPLCASCEARLADDDRFVCERCRATLRPLAPADAVYRQKVEMLSVDGLVSGVVSAFHFEKDGTLQHLVHQLKYEEMTKIGVELGSIVGQLVRPALGDIAIDFIVPVPLHPVKERERGYNQSVFIAEGISVAIGRPVHARLLKRVRHTRTQTALNTAERKENVAGAFALNARHASAVREATVLLVDDIITTGATIIECARALKHHGALHVYAASIAIPDLADLP